tara:strand:- start:73 stop:603 length:531 start_codon:yes stop_codon:yes gene_type:complete
MTVRVTKSEFNLREKLSELDYSRVPYEKMPAGSIIQIKHAQLATQLLLTANGDILETTFTPFRSDSRVIIDIRLRAREESGNNSQWFVGLKKTLNGANSYPGGQYMMHSRSHPTYSGWAGFYQMVFDGFGSNNEEITYTLYAGPWGSNNGTTFRVNGSTGDGEVYGAQLIMYEVAQ